jgi:hypothetical protein
VPSQTFTADGTFAVPAGVTALQLECYGAGAFGGRSEDNRVGGSGSGGGAYSKTLAAAVAPGSVLSILVPAGGTASVGDPAPVQVVGPGAVVLCRAAGGDTGLGFAAGGLGGRAADGVGDVRFSGGDGAGQNLAGTAGGGSGGGGGAGPDGDGRPGAQANGEANAAGGDGGGGLAGRGGFDATLTSPNGQDAGGGGGGGRGNFEFVDPGDGGAGRAVVTWAAPPPVFVPGTWARADADGRVRRVDADPGLPP